MIIKKFKAKDSRSAMAQIRDEFGPEAILLSSKAVGDHFEMVAAPNYDDQDIERELQFQRESAIRQQTQQEAQQKAQQEALAKEQQTLKVLKDEMAEMRSLIEARMKLEMASPELAYRQNDSDNGHPRPAIQNNRQPNETRSGKKSAKKSIAAQLHIDQYLAHIGLSKTLRASLQRRIKGINKIEMASSKTMEILSNAVRELDTELFPDRGIAAFVGASGSGKTTALIKLAQQHRKRHGTEGIGLIQFGHKLNAKNKASESQPDLVERYSSSLGIRCIQAENSRQLISATRALSSKSLLLIDCAGSAAPDANLQKALKNLGARNTNLFTFLTLPADTSKAKQEYTMNAYADMASGAIVTKAGNPGYLGALVELLIRKKMPLGYIAETRKLDARISQGNSEKLIRMALSLGNLPKESESGQSVRAHQSRGYQNAESIQGLTIPIGMAS